MSKIYEVSRCSDQIPWLSSMEKKHGTKESLVSGLTFLHEHKPDKEVFKIQPDGTQEFVDWPEPMYPCIVVNIGSGAFVNFYCFFFKRRILCVCVC